VAQASCLSNPVIPPAELQHLGQQTAGELEAQVPGSGLGNGDDQMIEAPAGGWNSYLR